MDSGITDRDRFESKNRKKALIISPRNPVPGYDLGLVQVNFTSKFHLMIFPQAINQDA